MLFGVAEDHASNPIKIALGKLKEQGVKIVAVNPVRTGYNAIADEWIGIRPGTDGLFVGALIHELMRDAEDRSRLSRALHQRALAGDRRSGRGRRRLVRARRRRQAARRSTRPPARSPMRRAPTSRRRWSARSSWPTAASARPSFALIAERYPRRRIRARAGRGGDRRSRPRPSGASPRELAHAAFEQQVTLDIPWTDRAGRRHEKIDRPPGLDARHARHLRPLQRLPDLPDAASAADPAGLDRLPRRLSLQGAVPASDAAAEPPGASRARPRHAAAGHAARLPAGTGGSAGRRRRHAAAHRQGLFAGMRRSPRTA